MRQQVLHKIDVVETLQTENERSRRFSITFHFLPVEHYCEDKLLSPQQILNYMETRLVGLSVCQFVPVCLCANVHLWLGRYQAAIIVFVRFFYLLMEAIKKQNTKLSSIAVETRKATAKDKDHDGDASEPTAVSALLSE